MMNDLTRIKQELCGAIKQFQNWQMRGYDTPQLTYGEQLDLYQERVEILTKQLKEELK